MIEKQLLTLCLKKDFYKEHRNKLTKSLFTNGAGNFFETIQKAHDEYNTDLSLDEVSVLHTEKYNPALTRASKHNFSEMVNELREEDEPNENVIGDIIESLHRRNLAHKIAVMATDIYNGKTEDFLTIKNLLDNPQIIEESNDGEVTSDVGELLDLIDVTTKWNFNLQSLQEQVSGIGEGNLAVFFARPETGKTAFWVSLVANEGGFASQGAKVVALINEEPAVRTQMRLINAHTGMTREEIKEDTPKASTLWSQINTNIKLLDTVDWNLDDVNKYLEENKTDILIIDQLDKVNVSGTFARTDEKLRAIYTGAREIAKRHNICVIALSQASADGHNKLNLTFDMMEGSKTGKAAEADLIIGIGKRDTGNPNEPMRQLNISKNKINGVHADVSCFINPQLSRYDV
jgi:replicative DNA helicase